MGKRQTLAGPPLDDVTAMGGSTLGGLLVDRCARFTDHEALVFDDPLLGGRTVRWTYGELLREVRSVARSLLATGMGKGARVGILMGNRPEALASFFGAALAGAIAVPLSTFATGAELSYLLAHADLSILLLQTTMDGRRFADDIAGLCPSSAGPSPFGDARYPYLRHVAVLGPAGDAAGLRPWDRFIAHGQEVVSDAVLDAVAGRVHPSDLALAVHTSGTTDRPKGVLHNHGAVARQFRTQARLFGRDGSTRVWCAMPMFWTAGLNAGMGATLAAGATWVMQERFDAGQALVLLERERVSEPHTLAHQARALAAHPAWSSTDLSSCTKVYGKSVFTRHPTVTGDTEWNTPVGYGMTETSSFFTGSPSDAPRDELRNGSYGRLLPGNELRVIDPASGEVLGADQEGELIVRGPTLMEHHLQRTRAECFDADGFYRTGDIGSFDEDGFVYFRGRRTEMIKTGGANVSPAEIEVHLRAHPAVKVARAVGVPDDLRDEIVVLCVETMEMGTTSEDDIRSFLRERIAGYKVPRRVLFFEPGEIPLNGSGTKIRDDALIALAKDRLSR